MLCVFVGVLGWLELVSPERDRLAARRASFAKMQGELAAAKATAQRLPALQREAEVLDQSLRQMTALLQDGNDPQDVLRTLHDLAAESSLTLTRFAPRAADAKSQYATWPIALGLKGRSHDIGRFFRRIATLAWPLAAADLDIKADSDGLVTATCVATALVLARQSASPAPGGR